MPRCPNHRVPLSDVDWKGQVGICPISGAIFSFDADHYEKTRKLKLTNMGYKQEGDWKIKKIKGDDDV